MSSIHVRSSACLTFEQDKKHSKIRKPSHTTLPLKNTPMSLEDWHLWQEQSKNHRSFNFSLLRKKINISFYLNILEECLCLFTVLPEVQRKEGWDIVGGDGFPSSYGNSSPALQPVIGTGTPVKVLGYLGPNNFVGTQWPVCQISDLQTAGVIVSVLAGNTFASLLPVATV
jgi:hypothetical protein